VTDPVAAAYDADGRLYVVEMRGYPYPDDVPAGNVRLLEDRDGDGRFDASTIFLDGLSWPTSVVPYDGGVFVAVAPDILYAKDNDGDGRADVRKVAYTGFGKQNVQALVNGLLWGPDGWIYGVSGGNGGEIRNLSSPQLPPVSVGGRDFRFKPDGSAFEAISGGGQFGHSFDDWGHRFTCNNSDHIRQIVFPGRELERNPAYAGPGAIVGIAVEGGAAPVFRISPPEPWRLVRTRQRAADPEMRKRLPPTELVPIGFFTSASGITIYRGTAFPSEYRGNAFMGDVGGNLVHRKTLALAGSMLRATRADAGVEFLASTDNWFRPVNFANTPDGTLLVLDMYRETIEHPASIPDPIKRHLDLTSGHDRGRLYDLVPKGFRPRARVRLSRATTAQLVEHLADRDAWWREAAQRLLLERRDPVALPALRRLAAAAGTTAVGRAHAFWTLADLDSLRGDDLVPFCQDPAPGLREQVARLAGRLGRGDILSPMAEDSDTMVRLQVALALGDVPGTGPLEPLGRLAIRDGADPWIRAAVLSGLKDRADGLLTVLAQGPRAFATPEGHEWLRELSALVGADGHEEAMSKVVDRFVTQSEDPTVAIAAVLGLRRGVRRAGGSARTELDHLLASQIVPLQAKAERLLEGDEAPATRVEAARLFSLGPTDNALRALVPLLDARQPTGLALAALQTLGERDDPQVGAALVEHWNSLGPSLRREAAEILLSRRAGASALLDALDAKQIAPAELDPARQTQLRSNRDPELRDRAIKILGRAVRPERSRVIADYLPALAMAGDPSRGKRVFQKTCATCHRAGGDGHEVGPDLATVATRSQEDLLTHVLDPNREVAPAYVNYTLATSDGRVLSGLVAAETSGTVTLRRPEGATDVVPRSQIEAMASTGLSLMPENLETLISPAEMADLIVFVRSLAGTTSN
jgi:putative membrane-bound dehydrogenase-like protein